MTNIQDKISLRAYALKLAMERYYNDCRKTDEIIETADKFATYIQGTVEMPEFIGPTPPVAIINQTCPYEDEDDDDICIN